MKNFILPFFAITILAHAQENNIDWILLKMKNLSYESYEILKLYDDLPEDLSYTNNSGAEYSTTKSTPTFFYIDKSTIHHSHLKTAISFSFFIVGHSTKLL